MLRFFLTIYALALLSSARADEAAAVLTALDHNILPVLERTCFECHDNSVKKADIDLESLQDAATAKLDVRLWDKVREVVQLKTMPPPKKKEQPSEDERKNLLSWIDNAEKAVLAMKPVDPGTHKVRRLNRHEYGYTMRDLLGGVGGELSDKFPRDGGGGEGFDNNADTLFIPALLIEKYIEAADEGLRQVYAKQDLKIRLIKQRPDGKITPQAAASTNLRDFAYRAYRRDVTDADVGPLVSVFDQASKRGLDFETAMRIAFKAVLLSPKFLFLQEPDRAGEKQPWVVDGYDMASRLSYFLWSTMPDEQLLKLAHDRKLGDSNIIAQQVKRMLADNKGDAFARHFSGQWLRFDELFSTSDPDRNKFREFNDGLRQAMYDEALKFSDAVLRQNGNVLDFLDSNYTYVNEPLAKFYGWPGIQGQEFRRV
ncbi:MAG: Planctomycete cytochrome, partial [Verrucomicrobiaceae bacterium]|nr:Planctomycete cytochrome [Verrucomicrobiaceae bacterium]